MTKLDIVRDIKMRIAQIAASIAGDALISVLDGTPCILASVDGLMYMHYDRATGEMGYRPLPITLIGTQWWSPDAAARLLAAVAVHPAVSTYPVKIMRRAELRATQLATYQRLLTELEAT